MKIALPCQGDDVLKDFSKLTQLRVFEVADGKAGKSENVDVKAAKDAAAALKKAGATVLLCGDIDDKTAPAIEKEKITIVKGISGKAADAVNAYLAKEAGDKKPAEEKKEEAPAAEKVEEKKEASFSGVLALTDETFAGEVFGCGDAVAVLLFAESGEKSKKMQPVFEEASKLKTGVKFTSVDLDKFPQVASSVTNITGLPTVLAVHNKKVISSMIGVQTKEDIVAMFDGIG